MRPILVALAVVVLAPLVSDPAAARDLKTGCTPSAPATACWSAERVNHVEVTARAAGEEVGVCVCFLGPPI